MRIHALITLPTTPAAVNVYNVITGATTSSDFSGLAIDLLSLSLPEIASLIEITNWSENAGTPKIFIGENSAVSATIKHFKVLSKGGIWIDQSGNDLNNLQVNQLYVISDTANAKILVNLRYV